MLYLIAGLVIFLAPHCVRIFKPAFRDAQISSNEKRWKGLYSLVSLIGLVLMIWGYGQARMDNIYLYYPPFWLNHLQILLMIPVAILLVAAELPAGRIKKAVKNPMTIGIKIWAFGHLLVNGDLASILLFGSFLVWSVLLVMSYKRREQILPSETKTSSDIIAIVGGLVAWAAILFFLHEWLIGVPVIA